MINKQTNKQTKLRPEELKLEAKKEEEEKKMISFVTTK